MLYIFIIALILFLIFAWLSLGKDIFQPSCIIILSYIVCAISASIMQQKWEYSYHIETFGLVSLGLIAIYIVNFLFYRSRFNNTSKIESKSETVQLQSIDISLLVYVIVLGVQFLAIALYYFEILRITGGGISISAIMTAFRQEVGYGTEESVSFIATQMLNVSFAIGLVCLYIFINNAIIKGIKGNIRFFIPVLLYALGSLMTGGRFNVLIITAAGITMFAILYRRKNRKGFSLKIYLVIICLIALVLVGFYAIRELIGRTTTASQEASFVDYICTYVGGSLPLFDMYLQNPVAQSDIFGKETFTAINNTLIEWGLIDGSPYVSHLEFRIWNGFNLGNVYTGFRRNIQDFGMAGMIILQMLMSLIMSILYNRCKSTKSIFITIIYSWFAYTIWMHCVNDTFYGGLFTLGAVIKFVFVYIAYILIIKNKIGRIVINYKLYKRKQRC